MWRILRSPLFYRLATSVGAVIAILAVVSAAGTLCASSSELEATGIERAQTMAFTTLAAFYWCKAYSARSRRQSVFSAGFFVTGARI